jgi:predicted MFS family arabinose efflux permease
VHAALEPGDLPYGLAGLALGGFVLLSLAFPLLSVSSTLLTSALAPASEGEGMGMDTAVAALAGLLGAALGGWAADAAGYSAALVLAAAGLAVALVLSVPPRHPA